MRNFQCGKCGDQRQLLQGPKVQEQRIHTVKVVEENREDF